MNGPKLFHAIEVDDAGTMNAQEPSAAEFLFHVAHACTQQVGLLADMQVHVIADGLDPIDFFDSKKEDATVGFHGEALSKWAGVAQMRNEVGELGGEGAAFLQ